MQKYDSPDIVASKKKVHVPTMKVLSGEEVVENPESNEPPSIDDILSKCRIRANDHYAAPPRAISLVHGNEPITYGTLGNFSLVTGKAKSKKTFLMVMVIAACLKDDAFQDTIRCDLPTDKRRIIVIDTEQSKYHVWKRLNTVASLCGPVDLDAVEVYSFREFPPSKRTELIEHISDSGNPAKNIGLIIIDGIRDLIHDINDPKEATYISTKLMQWTTLADCHIITVLHQNKGDQNARGHVGTELVNKAETVISVTVAKDDKSCSIVEAEETRGRDFPAFAFRISDTGIPEIQTDFSIDDQQPQKKRSFDFYNIPPETHHRVLGRIFKGRAGFSYPEMTSEIKTAWQSLNEKFGDNEAKKIIAYYSQMGWLSNDAAAGKRANYKYNPDPV